MAGHRRDFGIVTTDADQDPYRASKPRVEAQPAVVDGNLPPFTIKLFAFIFAWFILTPTVLATSKASATLFSFRFAAPRDPFAPICVLLAVFTLAGAVGISILLRFRFAYDLAIGYCVLTICSIS